MKLLKRIYDGSGPFVQYSIDYGRYALGKLPRVGAGRATAGYPRGGKATVVFSIDFELAWAWRFSRSGGADPLGYALKQAEQSRRNFPELLALFDRHEVPVTWATVGHLFLRGCEKRNGQAHEGLPRMPRFENEYWRYDRGDWFDADPCCLAGDAPAWYAPDLIQAILDARVEHEIACHTFSHLDLSDGVCPPNVAEADLTLCRRVAAEWGIDLRTLVFPANLRGNLAALKRAGLRAYRHWTGFELDWPRLDEHGLWLVPGGTCIEKPNGHWGDREWLSALYRHVERAVRVGAVCSFWFHPSADLNHVRAILPALLEYICARRDKLWIGSMSQLVTCLERQEDGVVGSI